MKIILPEVIQQFGTEEMILDVKLTQVFTYIELLLLILFIQKE
jgi:hypothetical protein